LELRQDLSTPPRLFSINARTGESRLLLDLNPELKRDAQWGRVAGVSWNAKDGKRWTGRLYYPLHYHPGRSFPLVIRGGPYASLTEFSLSGEDINMTVGGAAAMTTRDIAVLLANAPDVGLELGSPREFDAIVAGYEGAIDHFVATGLADPKRIGVMGVSRAGDRALHFLTQSTYPIAAAIAADNLDDSYLQYSEWGAQVRAGIARDIGAEPVGEGLKVWLERAPGFNVSKIRAPLRLERDSRGLVGAVDSWEIFSQLRYLKRPVEYYFIPNVEKGTHQLTSPVQLLASQEGTLDWFDFWLNSHEDPLPTKAGQYARWRKLRSLSEGVASSTTANAIKP
jgi:hypothetical protein